MQIDLYRKFFSVFRVKNDEIPLTFATKIWYNFCVMVTKTRFGIEVIVEFILKYWKLCTINEILLSGRSNRREYTRITQL